MSLNGKITITRPGADGLTLETWEFWYNDREHKLVVDRYYGQARQTKRHQWRSQPGRYYNRLSQRDSSMKVAEVPLPEDVAAEARAVFYGGLTVGRWEGR